MKWSEQTWNRIEPVYNEILALPFIQELINGTLAKEKFFFYLQQDAIYLGDYGKVLAGIASKLKDPEQMDAFIHFSGDSVAVEKALHESYLQDTTVRNVAASPSCLLYTSYLFRQLANEPVEVAVAAVLPCFWIYERVGEYILANQKAGDNPYQAWIDTYGGEDFSRSVALAISIADELAENCTAEQQAVMTEAFFMASRFEWMFWESAYNREQWKIGEK